MAAATSAAISMEMRWMCPLFCMIKYRRKKRLDKPDPPPSYPAGAVVRKGKKEKEREGMSKNPCAESKREGETWSCLSSVSYRQRCNSMKKKRVPEKFSRETKHAVATSEKRKISRRNELSRSRRRDEKRADLDRISLDRCLTFTVRAQPYNSTPR